MLRRTRLFRLIDDPGAWCRGILTHAKDELLLTDWKDQAFQPYDGCELRWEPADGFVKNFQLRGEQRRIFGQFAMRFGKQQYDGADYKWCPALIDTGAKGIYLCQRTLSDLGVKDVAGSIACPHGPTVRIGNMDFPHVQTTEAQGDSAAGAKLDGDLNILGMDFLGEEVLAAIRNIVERRIGHPTPVEVIVTDGAPTNPITFGIAPSKPVVWALKQAIKQELERNGLGPVNAFAMTIKTPDGTKMGAEDQLHAGKTYVFVDTQVESKR